MAIIKGYLGDYKKQLKYNQKSLAIIRDLSDIQTELQILNNIGDTYLNLEDYEKALSIFKSNLQHPQANKLMKCVSAKNLGECYYKMGALDQAEQIFLQALDLAHQHQHKVFVSAANFYLGNIYLKKKHIELANTYLANAVKFSEHIGAFAKERLEIYEAAIQVSIQAGKIEKLKKIVKDYTTLNKQIHKNIQHRNIQRLQFQFSINEIEKERRLLKAQNLKLQAANQKIEQQREALLNANEELKSFAHMVSHDIKEPIRTVSNFTKMLEKELREHLTPKAKTYVQFIDGAAKRITTFVSDILKYATADQSESTLKKVDCNEVLRSIELNIYAQLQETNGQLIVESLPTIQADPSLITQVFQNLISNAIKFRKLDVPPIVTIKGYEQKDSIVFEIIDNGIGIKKEDQGKIFQLFKRLNNKSKYEGSGIGLSTVLKVLKRYDATIDLSSEPERGTIFYLRFPR